jgi:hypothetical protein
MRGMAGYQSLQVSPDGKDYITDHARPTVADVWDAVSDQGSRWYFYPIPFVVTAGNAGIYRKRIIGAPDGFRHLEGMTVHKAMCEIENDSEYVSAILA